MKFPCNIVIGILVRLLLWTSTGFGVSTAARRGIKNILVLLSINSPLDCPPEIIQTVLVRIKDELHENCAHRDISKNQSNRSRRCWNLSDYAMADVQIKHENSSWAIELRWHLVIKKKEIGVRISKIPRWISNKRPLCLRNSTLSARTSESHITAVHSKD